MAIETTNSAAGEIFKKAAARVPGTARIGKDPRVFATMLQSGYGINGAIGKSDNPLISKENMITGLEMLSGKGSSDEDAALAMLGYDSGAKGLTGLTGGQGGLDKFQGNALATLSRLAMQQEVAEAKAAAPPAAPRGGSSVRRVVDKSSVRMAVNPSSRHPDDLGHLGRTVAQSEGGGFTQREEELLLAAAGAENILAETSRVEAAKDEAKATRKVLPSTLQFKAGRLSAQYESNCEIDCIGYDRRGGTSYGQYQIASKTGTMDYFIKFLDDKAPDLAARLKAAGPADTGGRSGRMPTVWKRIAASDPRRFEALQHEFIRSSSYSPAAKSIVLTTGVDVTKRSYALREVLWSTAVQHGPGGAERIFSQAIEKAEGSAGRQDFDKAVIEEVYRIRSRKFFRHNKRVREAVQSRFRDEKTTAIALLDGVSA
ncbi:conserved hypothetical protein [Solidesulfovibrio fructosivorans JJ]]|uniref:Type VI secretion system spike protein VgrG3-like C-terminal domain-containing protein n=1 Tax=Solidesulfovibrio fructosivorans JJ] TaxID=596151 RepID=E1JSB4_SOLFR|nr:hypothetical protein [Solidesulfovibrio fructosivorans]EFL52883.1 conserved hypothetical protein [Solidesulfovibrio fructosivorans JJ]]